METEKCCGNCLEFLYEDTDGVGWCRPKAKKAYCGGGEHCNEHKKKNKMANKEFEEIKWGLLVLLLASAVVLMCGCKSSQSSQKEKVIVRDSINVITRTHTDTLHIIERDTIYEHIKVQDSTHASITLDSGTLDLNRGLLTGITSIDLTNVLNEWRERAQTAERELMQAESARDSMLNATHEDTSIKESAKEVQRAGWWQHFATAFTLASIVVLIMYLVCRIYGKKL